jgi:dipeptidyl-peptidase-4
MKRRIFIIDRLWILISVFAVICLVSGLSAQEPDPGLLTLDRIISSREFQSERFGPVKWLKDGTGYTTLESSEVTKPGRDIVLYNPQTGEQKILIRAQQLIPPGKQKPLDIRNYSWSDDGSKLLIFTNTRRVWRYHTRGDYWVLDLDTGTLQQLGKFAEPSTLKFAKFSPDTKKVAYVVKNNIYVEDIETGKITGITFDGSKTIINGTFDWAYEEEFQIQDGFRWSPDSRSIAYWQLDASGVRDFYMINNTDSLYSYIIPVQYPKVGETLSSCRVGVIRAEGGETVWMNVDGDPRNNYIPRMDWAASSEKILFQYMNRHQNRIKVMLGDAFSGEVKTILEETDNAWLDVVDDLKWMDNGQNFTWISERSGWRHLYLVSRDGKTIKPITSGDYDIISVMLIDEDDGYVYFIAAPDNPTQRYLFRIKTSGEAEPEKLTSADLPGSHSYQLAPNAKWAIHTWSDFNTPGSIDIISLPDHKSARLLVENTELKNKVNKLERKPVEFFKIKTGDNVELDGWMIKPHNFDPTKKYPVLFYVYGEPAGTTVWDRWGGRNYLWHLMLTQKGYIVISIDNRGTRVPRGREWRKCVYKQIGILASSDQAKAARKISEWDFIDSNRLAIWGWSGGGSMTLNALLRYPDLYNTGMSVAPVPDQQLYDAIYQERYMTTPEENPEGFRLGSPITFAENLKGNLLIVHGTGDDNVHYQGTQKLINEFIKYNKHFTMMAYPNRSHGIYEGKGTTRHLFELLTRYLIENMPPGPGE